MDFAASARAEHLAALGNETLDLLVIGGGITGAGILWDAALRGVCAGLVERRDFASGTSSRSSKLIHGGLRYLQQGEISLVREAATERRTLHRAAPHLAVPASVLVPIFGRTRASRLKLRAGLWTFDRLGDVAEEDRHQMLDRAGVLEREPSIRSDTLVGGAVYREYTTDDARLVLAVLRSAVAAGGRAANYAELVELDLSTRPARAVVHDTLGGKTTTVRAHVVVNAAGPWVDQIRSLAGPVKGPRLHLTKGIHIVVSHGRLPLRHIVIMTAPDRRGIFAVPHDTVTYIGTTDTDFGPPADEPDVTAEDIGYLLTAVTRTFPDTELGQGDVTAAWAGLRPLIHQEGKAPSEISRRDEIMISPRGLISVAGGKLTTFRKMAERVLDLVTDLLRERDPRRAIPPCPTEEQSLWGGALDGKSLPDLTGELRPIAERAGLHGSTLERIVGRHGTRAREVLSRVERQPALARHLDAEGTVILAEVDEAVEEEMAVTVRDFLERRSRLMLFAPDNGLGAVEAVAERMGEQLGWDEERRRRELAGYRAGVSQARSW